jgi:predicted MFS family arabinose efflux permease
VISLLIKFILYYQSEHFQRIKVLCAGIFSLILSMGLARFSYTPLLPLMHDQAGLGLAHAGLLAAINYTGYLLGALLASRINDLVVKDRLYRIGMVIAVVSTIMMGMTDNFTVWVISRFIAGLSSAAGLMLGSGLILNWLIRHNHHSELGIHFSGVGLGIAVCSAAVIVMSPSLNWSEQWFVFSTIGVLLLIPALGWFPAPDRSLTTKAGKSMLDCPPSPAFLRLFMAAYFCAGFGYVVTATFIVAIVDSLPGLNGKGNLVFLVIGLAAGPSCIAWDFIARRIGELNALVIAAVFQIVGILLPVFGGGLFGAIAGALLFGGTCMGIVSLVLSMAGRYYPTRPAKMMGKMTIAYGIAQIIGPAITAQIASSFGNYSAGLYIAAGVMTLGSFLFYLLKRMEATNAPKKS